MSRIGPEVVTAVAMELAQMRGSSNRLLVDDSWRAKNLLLSGRKDEAAEIVMPALIEGTASPVMQKVAAALYYFASGKAGRGPRLKPRPQNWHEIGTRYDQLYEAGLTYDDVLQKMVEEFKMSKSSVETSLRFYKAVYKKLDELQNPSASNISINTQGDPVQSM